MAKLSLPNEALAPYPTRAFLRDIASAIRPYWVQLTGASLLRLTADIINLYPPFAFGSIITLFSRRSVDPSAVWTLFALWAAAILGRQFFQQTAKWLGYQAAERVALDAKLRVLTRLQALDLHWHERESSGAKLKRIERGGDSLNQLIRLWINSYIEIGVTSVGVLVIIAHIDRTLVGILLVFMLVYFFLAITLGKPATLATRRANVEEETFTGLLFELIANVRTVKVLGLSGGLLSRINRQAHRFFAAIQERVFRFQSRSLLLNLFSQSVRFLLAGVMIAGILGGTLAVGFLVTVLNYYHRIIEAVAELADNAQQVAIARDGVARLQAIATEPIGIDDDAGKQPMPVDWHSITADQVSFAYGKHRVLKDVSFTLRRGEKVGIVGLSGAGKSTLFKLLLKEHEGFGGQILVDDVPLTRITRSSFIRQSAVVLQDTEVFNFSLRDNVTLASAEHAADGRRLAEAIEVAHVTDFLGKLPQGLDTLIGEKGFRLSGGERQRLGIARAIFKRPELLFLDEATSHLDSESEAKIQDSLGKFFTNVTAIVIAHRLSTIKQMDRILVLEKGRIIEDGSFNQLYRAHGRFRELWEKQKL